MLFPWIAYLFPPVQDENKDVQKWDLWQNVPDHAGQIWVHVDVVVGQSQFGTVRDHFHWNICAAALLCLEWNLVQLEIRTVQSSSVRGQQRVLSKHWERKQQGGSTFLPMWCGIILSSSAWRMRSGLVSTFKLCWPGMRIKLSKLNETQNIVQKQL